jgi:hypothetical protein
VRDLDRITVRAVQDVRAAMREIAAMPLPKGSEARMRPFVDAVRALAPRLDGLVSAGEFADSTRMLVAVDKLQRPATDLERHARRAGLRVCARKGFAERVTDALVTPLFVDTLTATETALVEQLRRVDRMRLRSAIEVGDYFNQLWSTFSSAKVDFGSLYAPSAAADELNDYMVVLVRAENLASRTAEAIYGGKPLTLAWRRQLGKRFRALGRRQAAAFARIFDALGTEQPPARGSAEES